MSVGQKLKAYLESKGIRQNFVAEQAGIPAELFRRSLEGKRKIPAEEFLAICRVLELDLDFFRDAA